MHGWRRFYIRIWVLIILGMLQPIAVGSLGVVQQIDKAFSEIDVINSTVDVLNEDLSDLYSFVETVITQSSVLLVGDVVGLSNANTVALVGGESAANVAAATALVGTATSENIPNTIVQRDASGNFSADTVTTNVVGDVTGNLFGNATTATTADTATDFSGALAGDVVGFQNTTTVSIVGGQTAANVALATIAALAATASNVPNTIVERDGSGNFATNMVTLNGTVSNATDATTKSYVNAAVAGGLEIKDPVLVVSLANLALSGTPTIDGVLVAPNDRVLLIGQTDPIENGIWLSQVSTWSRPLDFASGTTAGIAYALTMSGNTEAGSGWICNTPLAIIDTDPNEWTQFSIAPQTNAANVGTGAGQVFRDKTGSTLNFKTIAAGTHQVVTNNADDVTLSTDATSANTASTIVSRDASGNFTAGSVYATTLRTTGGSGTSISSSSPDGIYISYGGSKVLSGNNVGISCNQTFPKQQPNYVQNAGIQFVIPPDPAGGTINLLNSVGYLVLRPAGNVTSLTINFPAVDNTGDMITILNQSSFTITGIVNSGAGSGYTIVNEVAALNPVGGTTAVTYWGDSGTSSWYRLG